MTHKVLIVDDSKLARMSIARMLDQLRPTWTRVEAANATEAMALRSDAAGAPSAAAPSTGGPFGVTPSAGTPAGQTIDVVLLDFNMPGRDGLALAADLRELDPEMPMAIISANIQDEIVARAAAIGAAFLPKPLTQTILAQFLDSVEHRLKSRPA